MEREAEVDVISTPISVADWRAEGERLFGADPMGWRFVCPVCKHVASVKDWKDAGAGEGEVAFSCIGRHTRGRSAFGGRGKGPCNYTGGGLFKLNPVSVVDAEGGIHNVFAFAKKKWKARKDSNPRPVG